MNEVEREAWSTIMQKAATDRQFRLATSAALLLELREPLSARMISALYGVSPSTVRRRLASRPPTQTVPEYYWSAEDIRREFGHGGGAEQ